MSSVVLPGQHQPAATGQPGFARRLKDSTKAVHREAERAGFVADLIRGRATPRGYAIFLRNLVPVYDALERAIDAMHEKPLIVPFSDPGLRRLPRLMHDLVAIAGADWRASCPVSPAADLYAAAIGACVEGEGVRLAAHAYARYLGDLSGGQILRPILAKSLSLGDDALSVYDFPDVADVERPKEAIRATLDGLDPVSADADALIEEAILAFRHNIALSDAVSAIAASEAD